MSAAHLNGFSGKKVFLTGHTGFKGSWMSVWLDKLGAQVKGYALAPEEGSLYPLIEKSIRIESEIADIRDADRLKNSIVAFQPDFIFHMAAQPLVLYSYQYPVETFEVNTLGTAHLLDAVRQLEKPCSVVVVTTDKVYENHEWVYPYRETDALGGYDPYSASKAAAEIVTASYRSSFFNPKEYAKHKKGIASARAGNVIGGGDFAKDRLVPDIVRALNENKEVILRNPASVRPWQHVLEPIHGYFLLALALEKKPQSFSEGFNFGPEVKDSKDVLALAQAALECWGGGKLQVRENASAKHEAGLLMLDFTKALSRLNWVPRFGFEDRVSRTIGWYRKFFREQQDPALLIQKDIEYFLSLK